MVQRLLKEDRTDAVLAIKSRSAGGPRLRMARRGYYRVLGISSRLQLVPSGRCCGTGSSQPSHPLTAYLERRQLSRPVEVSEYLRVLIIQ
jgi:hypothetical protein